MNRDYITDEAMQISINYLQNARPITVEDTYIIKK